MEWVTAHCPDLKGEELKAAQEYWRSLKSDDDAHFDIVHTLDASALEPMVTWGTSPDQAVGISESVPEADSFADPDSHTAAVRACLHRFLHEREAARSESRGRCDSRTPCGTGSPGAGCSGLHAGEAGS